MPQPGRWQPLCVLTPAGVAAGAPMEPADGNCVGAELRRPDAGHPAVGQRQDVLRGAGSQYRVYGPPMNPDGTVLDQARSTG